MIRRLVDRLRRRRLLRAVDPPVQPDEIDWTQCGPGASTWVQLLGFAQDRERNGRPETELVDELVVERITAELVGYGFTADQSLNFAREALASGDPYGAQCRMREALGVVSR